MRRSRIGRVIRWGVPATLVAAAVLNTPAADAAGKRGLLLAESFSSPAVSTSVWSSASPKGAHTPCLTAATSTVAGSLPACNAVVTAAKRADSSGAGTFQLTDNVKESGGDAGVLVLNQPQSSRNGLHVAFDMYQYNAVLSGGVGGDGLSFYLVDGAQQTVMAGQPGGSLGYQGVPGAFVGVGFDEYGNFSNPAFFSPGDKGPGNRRNRVVVRGAASTNYQYIQGVDAPGPLAVDGATSRASARRTVNIDVSTQGIMSVYMDFYDGQGKRKILSDIDLNHLTGQPSLPETVKLGFAASTWSATAFHEINNFSISQLDPDLSLALKPTSGFRAGGTGTLAATVSNDAAAGPTTGPVTSTFTLPTGLTPVSVAGSGWTCSTSGQQVSCTRPDVLPPGVSYPDIIVKARASSPAPATVTVNGTVTTAGEHEPKDNAALTQVPITPAPDLSFDLTAEGPTLTGVTSNAPGAGPSDQPVTMTIPIPQGATVKKIAPGTGWTCTQDATAVTCKRSDPLAPGTSFPPVQVTLGTPDGSPLTGTANGRTDTPDEANPADNADGPVTFTVPAVAPNLSVGLTADGPFAHDSVGTYTLTVSNAATAGPTSGTVTVTQTVPKALGYVSAYGDYWTCSQSGTTVTCTRPGTGTDKLAPGASYPPITVRVQTPPAQVVSTVQVSTPADSNTADNAASLSTQLS